jgi:hypothetical protein
MTLADNTDTGLWPPTSLRRPTISGAHGTLKFAFFADKRRLLIESEGSLQIFDCGAHQIREVDEIVGERPTLEFISQNGRHPICELKLIN